MASNTAVVSSNSGGIPEVNIDGITGFLSDVGDINKMSDDICELISNSNLLSTFKLNALNHAKKFDLNNILPKYEEVYTKLIKNYD